MPMENRAGWAGQSPPPPAEQPPPSQYAELNIKVGPDHRWASVQGSVPPDQAHHLVTALSIWGSIATGIVGAVFTLRIGSNLSVLAAAELIAGLLAAALITACSFAESLRRKPEAASSQEQ
jgi:hypothetical protein